MNIFEIMFDKYKITKPIRLIELFGGYGSQHFALEYLSANFEHWKLCEWAVKSIQAYKDAHYSNDNTDYSKGLTKQELIDYLFKKQISQDYNAPMDLKQISRQKEEWLRQVYNNIIATKNTVDITQTKASDLGITDTDKYTYIMTYSFPCQDLSLAGLGKGMARDSGTRSGLLWEVERILDECTELPQILLMENVPDVKGTNNVKYFNEWQHKLESLGYKNYHQNLIATDYGIPQTRNRTFMVSILGEYSYTFPQPIPLKLKLKDMLEDNVDEKYYLSDKMLKGMMNTNFEQYKLENKLKDTSGNADTIVARFDGCPQLVKDNLKTELCNELIEKGIVKENDVIKHNYTGNKLDDKRLVPTHNISPTLDTRCDCLGVVQKDKMQTLKTSLDTGVVDNYGIATNESKEWQKQPLEELSRTLLSNKSNSGVGVIESNLRIRKLTPKECFRLMGVKDEDYERIAKNQSNASLYHLAGDSIVVNVLMAIFGELFDIER